ncbi:Methionyl-tRNA formyltransferase [Roseivivax jejudonensis]|uniref:Methionyl-tRNA formyltransferase n=1 Tax=Roseivivax jejudonensis TaxID=1529041 RepID=A0A1X6Y680_9RHOB|nr:formyltransferase family protein [Roseivivax jejudonensis]SLN11587.1 Methionyl-tRNA formyltransferase [Roseivivax jejudonensis]
MRVLILTSKEFGIAGTVLAALHDSSTVADCAALLCDMTATRKDRAWLQRKARKTWRIGVGGAVNGLRIRSWFDYGTVAHLPSVCDRLGMPLLRAPGVNSDEAVAQVKAWAPDLMISLGNPIIHEKVFGLPLWGTVNFHGELLPDYPGAQSILWPIHDGRQVSGFTIHKVARRLDGGDILVRREVPIVFRTDLRATIEATGTRIQAMVPAAFRDLVEHWPERWQAAAPNPSQPGYTTPTLRQFRRMVRNNRRLHAAQQRKETG